MWSSVVEAAESWIHETSSGRALWHLRSALESMRMNQGIERAPRYSNEDRENTQATIDWLQSQIDRLEKKINEDVKR